MKCKISTCENEATSTMSELCSACKSARYSWGKKGPRRRLKRLATLAMYSERLTTFFADAVSSKNVIDLDTERKRRTGTVRPHRSRAKR